MAGLYIHFPFCKQACHYCNFHFSTQQKNAPDFHHYLIKELQMRHGFLKNTPLESIYFGGGSPSLLTLSAVEETLAAIRQLLPFAPATEITLELNPDDVTHDYLKGLQQLGINRVSIGIQSFWTSELQMMNRVHDAYQGVRAIEICAQYFDNYSIDLIYGMPGSSLEDWQYNLDQLRSYQIPHLAAYALTVEPQTALAHQVAKGKVILLPEEEVERQYFLLLDATERMGLINYEFSNFGKENYFSVNNSNYWKRKPYLGLGPGAHSYDGEWHRNWNVSNNALYQKSISEGKLANTSETLTQRDRYNEYIMTGLRTKEGVNRNYITQTFGVTYAEQLEEQAKPHVLENNLFWDGDALQVCRASRFLSDGIAADLFLVNLNQE